MRVQRCAAELLSRYIKQKDGNFLLQAKSSSSQSWLENHGLAVSRVTRQSLTADDRMNNIRASYWVSLESKMFRTYDVKKTKWSEWHSGRYLLLPAAICVTENHDGKFAAKSSTLSRYTAFSARGNPDSIPCVRQKVTPDPAPLPSIQPPLTQLPKAHTKKPLLFDHSQQQPEPTPDESPGAAAGMAALLLVAGILAVVVGGKQNRKRRVTSVQHKQPPPLPPGESTNSTNHSLIVGQTHLLTPAEQSFLAVLQPIVQRTCSISTKVRLADLFQVKKGRGQQSAFNRISRKHVDFVLTEPTSSRILCAIELDDSSHNRPDRIARDQFVDKLFASNQMPLIHISFAWQYNPDVIREKLVKAGVPLM